MSMEDILKVLIDSRQPGSQGQAPAGQDPMTALVGNLLGGGQTGSGSGSGAGLGDMMGLLESVMGAGAGRTAPAAAPGLSPNMALQGPILSLLQPTVDKLARKVNISPEIAMLVVSFVVQKLLAHHPTSGRDSTQFDLDDVLGQLSGGGISPQTLQSSGLVSELSRTTGLDPDSAERSLAAAFGLVGSQISGTAGAAPQKAVRKAGAKSARGGKSRSMKRPGTH